MKANIAYTITVDNRKTVKLLKEFSKETLSSSKTNLTYYLCRGLEVKLSSKVIMVKLKKVKGGLIFYMSNGIYSIGEFIFITDKEFELLSSLGFKPCGEKYCPNTWRHFWYKDSIIEEFTNPIDDMEAEINELEGKINSNSRWLAERKKQLEETKKRF